jgi:hypothetical protein
MYHWLAGAFVNDELESEWRINKILTFFLAISIVYFFQIL